jgi:hypothetical protein
VGSRGRERDTLPWHKRRGAWQAPETHSRTEFSEDIRRKRLAAINPNWK